MTVEAVLRELQKSLEPALVSAGFSPLRKRRWRREAAKWVDVVQLRFFRAESGKDYGEITRQSLTLCLGRYFKFAPGGAVYDPPVSWADVDEAQCHLRKSVYPSRSIWSKKSNVWHVGEHGENLSACSAEMASALSNEVLPWFSWLQDLDAVLKLLTDGQEDMEGRSKDTLLRGTWGFEGFFGRHVVAGLVAFERQHWSIVVEQLKPVLTAGGVVGRGGLVLPLEQHKMDIVRAAHDDAVRRLS